VEQVITELGQIVIFTSAQMLDAYFGTISEGRCLSPYYNSRFDLFEWPNRMANQACNAMPQECLHIRIYWNRIFRQIVINIFLLNNFYFPNKLNTTFILSMCVLYMCV